MGAGVRFRESGCTTNHYPMSKPLLPIALKAAIAAGKKIMEVYTTDFEVVSKKDNSPLTIADRLANTSIISHLTETGIPIISEENKQLSYAVRKKWERCWLVDPLDGTKEFVKRNGEFTVNIALIENGDPVLGVIYIPVTKTLYFTTREGTAAFVYELQTTDTVKIKDILKGATAIFPQANRHKITIVGSRSHLNEATERYINNLGKDPLMIARGSSLKFCVIAEGGAQMYPRFAPTMEWDTAAGHAICRAVGVEVINLETGKPLRYNKSTLLNPFFLVNCNTSL